MKLVVLLQALPISAVPWSGRRQDLPENAAPTVQLLPQLSMPGYDVLDPRVLASTVLHPSIAPAVFLPPALQPAIVSRQISGTSPFISVTNTTIFDDLNFLEEIPRLPLLIMRRNIINGTDGNSTGLLSTTTGDIFATPIDTSAPISAISARPDHPVPRLGIQSQGTPISTNKFYANFFLGSQTAGAWTHPYQVSWANGSGSQVGSWGLAISHIDADQRVMGPNSSTSNGASYFVNPNGMQSMILSAAELLNSTTLTTSNSTAFSTTVNLSPTNGSTPAISFPLVQGMGFVTGVFNGATPLIQTSIGFLNMTRAQSNPKVGVTKYTFITQDTKKWYLYAYSPAGSPLNLKLSGSDAQADSGFQGVIQIAKDPGDAEAMYDAGCGTYPTDAGVSGTVAGSTGSYSLAWTKAGLPSPLIMFALPHHVNSFSPETNQSVTSTKLMTTTKGMATAVVGDSWDLVEPSMPVTIGFAPWTPENGSNDKLSPEAISAILPIARAEIAENMTAQIDLNSMYYSGKGLAKFAGIVYTLNDLLGDQSTAKTGLDALKEQFALFTSNKNQFPLVHDTAWGGIVSSASYPPGDAGADFGNTYYNDHHFHYGYLIYAGAIIAHLDPSWLLENQGVNKDYINGLARDIANPSTKDTLFPVYRNFDWYHGHSWAHGLYETFDGKDQESSSEDSMSAYALKMWGHVIRDANMEARGNLQLAVTARSLQNYFLYDSDNDVQPSGFTTNRVSGILFENKVDHTTYFGDETAYIQGIHMLPLLPHSTFTRTKTFVQEEWKTWFDGDRANQVTGGWRGVLMANSAIVDAKSAWQFFSQDGFDKSFLDGGASRTWYLAWIAGLGGA